MTHKTPGKHHQEGISLKEIFKMFPDSAMAGAWFAEQRWHGTPACPHCGSINVQSVCMHKTMPYRCRKKGCAKRFSVKVGTVMEGSNLNYRAWAAAMYLMAANPKGVSSIELHHELGITQKSAWHLAHRLREGLAAGSNPFIGSSEVDEAYVDGRERNKHARKKPNTGHETAGKTNVAGMRCRKTNKVAARSAKPFPASSIPVVNVATVPQRSPLRYPGGKTWLIPHIRHWLESTEPEILIEPFAGGAIVSLTAVMENLVKTTVMVEIDRDVAAFWRSALENGDTLQERVTKFKPTLNRLRKLEQDAPSSVLEHGFRTLVLNRTKRNGILAPGASFSRNGEGGKGLLSRWYPDTLADRLAAIQEHARNFIFLEGDGLKLLPVVLEGWGNRAAVFLDPPYTAKGGKKAGSRLYDHSNIDHAALFSILAEHDANFLMTYDPASEIVELVRRHNFNAVGLSMKNGHHNKMREIVVTSKRLFA